MMASDLPDKFGEVATEKYLFDKHGFGLEHIKEACVKMATPAGTAISKS
jgi:hypothetical protein